MRAARPEATTAATGARGVWPGIALLYLCGLLAAVQLGKFSALAPLVAVALGLSLTAVGVVISLVEVGGALFGRVAGGVAQRLGLQRTLQAGLGLIGLAGLGQALAPDAPSLFAGRLLEALGYLAVIVSAPVLIVRQSGPAGVRTQALALTLWSTFVPVGLALGAWSCGALAQALGWRGACAVWGVLGLGLAAGVVWRDTRQARTARPLGAGLGLPSGLSGWSGAPRSSRPPSPSASPAPADPACTTAVPVPQAAPAASASGPARSPGVRRLALGFGGFAIFEVGMLGLMPTLLVQQAGLDAAAAGRWTALASLAAVPGSALAAWWLRRGHGLRAPCMLALGLPPVLLFGVFTPQPNPAWALGLAIAANVLGGVFASLAFVRLPQLAPQPAAMVRANGWIAQCGASGSLLGPPLMAAAVQAGGWPAAAGLGLVVSALALPLVWSALGVRAPG